MRNLFTSVLALFIGLVSYASEPSVHFNSNGTLKIAQFTDTHLCFEEKTEQDKTLARIKYIVTVEKPDLLVFTGDIVVAPPAKPMWEKLTATLDSYKIPYIVVLGNHDAEAGLPRSEIARLVTSGKFNLNAIDGKGELADMDFPVYFNGSVASHIFALDSHDYSPIKSVPGYAWFTPEQVDWMRERGKAAAVPSLAFFHIPLCEYASELESLYSPSFGINGEKPCVGALNTGMFAAMVEGGSVIGAFCGHDHDNDYIILRKGIALAYGRYSGDDTVYNNLRHGVRIISLEAGKAEFTTWIRDDDGLVRYKCHYTRAGLEPVQ